MKSDCKKQTLKCSNGLIWRVRRATETLTTTEAWRRRDELREKNPPAGDPALLERCIVKAAVVRVLCERGAPAYDVAAASEDALKDTLIAVRQDSDGAADLTDVLETLADTLTDRPDTEFCSPRVLIILTLLWNRNGETEAAKALLRIVRETLDRALNAGREPARTRQNLALVYCALSDIYMSARDDIESLTAAKRAWETINQVDDANYQRFVVARYRRVLKAIGHAQEIVRAAILLEQQLAAEISLQPADWILEWI